MSGPDNSCDRWRGRVAIVTGASGGIGAAICRALVRAGLVVVGVARQHLKVQAVADELTKECGKLHAIKCDVTNDAQVEEMFKEVTNTYGTVTLCVNNAGINFNTSLLDGSTEEWRRMLDVNVVGLSLMTKLAVQNMKDQGIDDGHIIHISSLVGTIVLPTSEFHFYSATKHAVRALAEGLRQELRAAKSHIRVTTLSPGLVTTEFFQNMGLDKEMVSQIGKMKGLTPDDVAASVMHALTAPAHVEINDMLLRPVQQDV